MENSCSVNKYQNVARIYEEFLEDSSIKILLFTIFHICHENYTKIANHF